MTVVKSVVLPLCSTSTEEKLPKEIIFGAINDADQQLRTLNLVIHDNPELCYEEFKAHDNITAFLKAQGFPVTTHAHGLQTSLVAEYGEGGRLVTFCAEYDALEGVGHACGHNLIATAAVSAFLGVVTLLKTTNAPGRVRLLGCPAEEGGGGKIKLIKAGAFVGVDAALMLHPTPPIEGRPSSLAGISYGTCSAAARFKVRFKGKAAHAGAMPWMGVNALDAATLAYTAVGMLRQQILPTDRINIVIRDGGSSSNIITDDTTVDVGTRSATTKQMKALAERVCKCFEGAAMATGCTCEITAEMDPYADLRPNESLCAKFAEIMEADFGREYYCDLSSRHFGGYGTDMGNVSYECPSFHGNFVIPVRPGENIHGPGFVRAAGAAEAHETTLQAAKGMAVTGWNVLVDDAFAAKVRADFEADKLTR